MPRPATNNTRINVFVPPKHLKVMKTLAKREGIPYSDIVREGIKREIIRRANKHKEESGALAG